MTPLLGLEHVAFRAIHALTFIFLHNGECGVVESLIHHHSEVWLSSSIYLPIAIMLD